MTENNKLKLKQIKFLIDCFFYNVLSVSTFQKKYFSNFTFHEFQKYQLLYSDNENVDYVYFIIEGEIELSLNKNMFELHILIKELINKSGNLTKFENYEMKNGNMILHF